jgi:hypothetical protein
MAGWFNGQVGPTDAKGAFSFARPEDLAVNPDNGQLIAFNATGAGGFANGSDTWGTVYTLQLQFDAEGNPTSNTATILYNGDTDPARTLRSPDNLTWSGPSTLLIQEDRSADWASQAGANPNMSSLLEVGLDGSVNRIAVIDQTAVPLGQFNPVPDDLGNWENSGIVDVSALFGADPGRYFLGDVQAHSLRIPGLVEGGQLFLLSAPVPEPASWAMMIAGFGVIGLAARRRRAVAVA